MNENARNLIAVALKHAARTKRYVSVNGKRPTNKVLDCDIEMWDFADELEKAAKACELSAAESRRGE